MKVGFGRKSRISNVRRGQFDIKAGLKFALLCGENALAEVVAWWVHAVGVLVAMEISDLVGSLAGGGNLAGVIFTSIIIKQR